MVVKEAGQLSEAANGDETSLITHLNRHFQETEQPHASAYPVHRLDRNVAGVMVYAKTKAAAAKLSAAVQENRLTKEYLAVVHGVPEQPAGIYEDLLWKDSGRNKTYVVTRPRKGVKSARLAYRVLEAGENRSLVHIRLYTGRSHQIRVQFASRKTPLVGDGKYGAKDHEALALASCRLCFPHPVTGAQMELTWLPETLGGIAVPRMLAAWE
ncbi:MAG: RluA family pseudouridine synthase [Oscillospiraceae bacterium]|nr:RluA family pseudouridine synthase [Oscillospiraceae bacterium]